MKPIAIMEIASDEDSFLQRVQGVEDQKNYLKLEMKLNDILALNLDNQTTIVKRLLHCLTTLYKRFLLHAKMKSFSKYKYKIH